MFAFIKQKLQPFVLLVPVLALGLAFAAAPAAYADTTIPGQDGSQPTSNGASAGSAADPHLLSIYKNQICDSLQKSDNVSCDDSPNTQGGMDSDEQNLCNQYPDKVASGCKLYTQTAQEEASATNLSNVKGGDVCGGDVTDSNGNVTKYPSTKIAINIGCSGKGNPILDMIFAIVRWLSDGVGLVIIGSVIIGGIQYSTSRDSPQAVQAAVHRLQAALVALLIFVFAYAILNYLIPGAVLQ